MISSTNKRGKTIPFKKEIKQKTSERKYTKRKFSIPILVMACVFMYLAISLSGEVQKLNAMRHNVAEIEYQMEQLQNKNAELHKTLELMKTNDYVEQVARENLGLVKPGESIIVPVEQQPEEGSAATLIIRDPNIKD